MGVAESTVAKTIPNMPARNPWLADSVHPTTHFNPGATDSVAHAGPTRGRTLTPADVQTIPNLFTSSPVVKRVGDRTIVIAPGVDGIRKIDASGHAFELVSFLPYPGLEALSRKITPEVLDATLAETDAAARAKDEAKILALSKTVAELGFSRENIVNGVYNLIDRDGFHYAVFGGLKIIKTTDDNDPTKPLRVIKVTDLARQLPADLAARVRELTAFTMTYDGHLVAGATGALFLLDRDLTITGVLDFPGESVDNSICVDESGIYIVTSRRMLKAVWTGQRLTIEHKHGGWECEYNTMTPAQARAAGALTASGGSGTTPTLMGFGDDPDKLVIIADADRHGTNAVAFWRDQIPNGFTQKPDTHSRRIADQMRLGISKVTIEPSPNVLGYGCLYLNCHYPRPVPSEIWGNAFTAGLTRPAPTGAQKLNWNSNTKSFEKAWLNDDIDNTDVVVPVVSAATGLIYFASKRDGRYEYVALDWDSGEERARWPLPDDSRKWNAYASGNIVLDDGDFLLGGFFTIKRVNIGDGGSQ